jgi:hypothetical protein
MSPLPAALQARLDQHATAAAAAGQSASGAAPVDPAAMLAIAKMEQDAPDPVRTDAYLREDGTVDYSVFAVPSAQGAGAPRPAAVVVAETPAPLTSEQLREVQRVDPNIALQVYDTQRQITGLTDEIARLRERSDQSAQLAAKVAELEEANRALRAQQASAMAATALSDGPDAAELTAEERAMFQNPALLAAIEKVADHRASTRARQLAQQAQQRIDALEQQMRAAAEQAQVQAKAARESGLRAEVVRAHPDAETVFKDPTFADYLKQRAPFSADTLHARLNAAWQNGDAKVVSEILAAYKQERAVQAPAPAVQQYASSQPTAAPSHAAAAAQPPAVLPMLSAKKYRGVSQLYFAGKLSAAEFSVIREAYDKALREGRVVDDNKA